MISDMTDYLEALDLQIIRIAVEAAFGTGDIDLLLNAVDAFQIRQQQAPAAAGGTDDTVFSDIQLIDALHRFRLAENINIDFEPFQFIRFDWMNWSPYVRNITLS